MKVPRALPFWMAAVSAAGLAGLAPARAEDSASVSPYIDSLRKDMKSSGPSTDSDSYTQNIQNKLKEKDKAEGQPTQSYTEQLKKDLGPSKSDSTSYTDQQRALMAPQKDGGAIDALKEGHSDLHARIVGDVHNAGGFRFGSSPGRTITAPGIQGTDFSTIYSSEFLPDFNLFYEYQPLHSETWGSLGFMVSAGLGIYKGAGVFQFQLQYPDGSGPVTGPSHVQSQLFEVPLSLGLTYRLNIAHYLRPFATIGPTLIGVYEQRNDGGDAHSADARGLSAQVGLSILLDWVSKEARWQMYDSMRIKHYYLTLEFDQISTFSGPVTISASGGSAGLTFEW
jgi:hypothetical protein